MGKGVSGLRNGMIGSDFCIDGTRIAQLAFVELAFSFQIIVKRDENKTG
jgi:hypothetical protein